MSSKNTSDSIEEYIKTLLAQAGIAELKRSEIADVFQVVPSQINYVIKTRFTESRGYIVESKRGGGGYIRIGRIEFSNHHELLCDLLHSVGEQISHQIFTDIIHDRTRREPSFSNDNRQGIGDKCCTDSCADVKENFTAS